MFSDKTPFYVLLKADVMDKFTRNFGMPVPGHLFFLFRVQIIISRRSLCVHIQKHTHVPSCNSPTWRPLLHRIIQTS
jgi:hypothetical protein